MARRTPARGAWALAGSLAVHAAAVAFLVTREVRPVVHACRAVELELVSLPRPAPPRPPPPVQPAPPRAPERRVTRSPVPPRVASAVARAPVAEPVAAPPESPPPPPAADVPRAVAALLPAVAFDGPTTTDASASIVVQGPRAIAPTPQALVTAIAHDTLASGRVERGLVHPYYVELGRTLVKRWDADRVAKAGLQGLTDQWSKNSKVYTEIWLQRAAAFGASGSPLDAPATSRRAAPVANLLPGAPGIDLEARREIAKATREQFKATRRALLRVVQDRRGKLVRVELVEPSNDDTVDREALVDVQRAALELPLPPAEAVGERAELSSLWSFELVVSITPPVPTVSFEFDEALGFVDVRLPLDRRIYKKVRLVAVD